MRRPPNQTGQGNRNIILKASRNDRRSDLPALGDALAPLQPRATRHAWAAERGFASIGLVQFRKIVVKTITEVMTGADDDAERLSPPGLQEGFRRAPKEKRQAMGGQRRLEFQRAGQGTLGLSWRRPLCRRSVDPETPKEIGRRQDIDAAPGM
jgi:hypothetical protein